MMAQSRGCLLLATLIEAGDWAGPVLALSPAGESGSKILKSAVGTVVVAVNNNDLLGGSHGVISDDDLDDFRQLTKGSVTRRLIEVDGLGPDGWSAETVAGLIRELAA